MEDLIPRGDTDDGPFWLSPRPFLEPPALPPLDEDPE